MAAERARSGHGMERANEVSGDRVQPGAGCKFARDIGHHRLEHILHRRLRRCFAENLGINGEQPPRLLVGGAPEHHAVDMAEMLPRLLDAADAAIDNDGHIRQRRLQPIDAAVVERRDVAVLLR